MVEPGGTAPADMFEDLAARLGGRLLREDGEPFSIVNDAFLDRAAEAADASDALMINIIRVPYSAAADENAWTAPEWFEDDFCRGPGNVFYVHPDGRIAVCCGFANENPQLIIGDIRKDDYRSLMRRASQSPFVRACYATVWPRLGPSSRRRGAHSRARPPIRASFAISAPNRVSSEERAFQ